MIVFESIALSTSLNLCVFEVLLLLTKTKIKVGVGLSLDPGGIKLVLIWVRRIRMIMN